MANSTANQQGSPGLPDPPYQARTPSHKLCIAGALALLLGGVGTLVMLSCCWHREAAGPAGRIPQQPPPRGFSTTVAVRLAKGAESLVVDSPSAGRWRGIAPDKWELAAPKGQCKVVASGKSLNIGGKALPFSSAHFTPDGGVFRLGKDAYRGSLLVQADGGGRLVALETVELEDYLRGVVGREMSASWPMDALMAQAVAARTFAVHRLTAGTARTYLTRVDMAYGGVGAEAERVDEAIRATAGVVLMHGGEVLPAYFHSCCGGRTSAVESVFGGPALAPLRGVGCSWCTASRDYRWRTQIALSELASKLSGWGITRVNTLDLQEKDPAGRAAVVVINGAKKVPANDFRLAVGGMRLKSTAFTAGRRGEAIEFAGGGWGHGVGMCQWGARGMAEAGKSWQEVLQHYYPGSTLARIRREP